METTGIDVAFKEQANPGQDIRRSAFEHARTAAAFLAKPEEEHRVNATAIARRHLKAALAMISNGNDD